MNVADAVEITKRQLQGSHRGQLNFLASAVSSAATSFTFTEELQGLQIGSVLSIGDELVYVRSTTPGTKNATVVRGWLGSTASTHVVDTVVEVNARWPRVEIKRALLDEIRSWGSSLFRVETFSATVGVSGRTIDLSNLESVPYRVLSVNRSPRTGETVDLGLRFRQSRESPTYPFGSIVLDKSPEQAVTVSVSVAMPFVTDRFDDSTDLETDVGLSDSMLDIPPLGAVWRLLSTREVFRLELGTQGEPRSAQEVQAGMTAAVAQRYRDQRDRRLADEAYRLSSRYPWRM